MHFNENLSLDKLCAQIGISKYHFIRVFKNVFGISPYHYQKLKRLEHGRFELLNGHSIFDTALRCGFADVPAFSKAFKQAFGQSPGTLQKSNS
jgi:AraC-like DNA-binding protein